MELRDFVSESLKQIIDGVHSAQEHATKDGAIVNPGEECASDYKVVVHNTGGRNLFYPICPVEFDVAVTSSETSTQSGKVGVGIQVLTVGGHLERAEASSLTSRIKFTVPIVYTPHP